MIVPLKLAEITFRASPSLMLSATCLGVIPFSNSFTDPSGNVIFIIELFFNKLFKIQTAKSNSFSIKLLINFIFYLKKECAVASVLSVPSFENLES